MAQAVEGGAEVSPINVVLDILIVLGLAFLAYRAFTLKPEDMWKPPEKKKRD